MRTYLLVSSKIEYPVQQEPINRIVLHVSSSLIIFDFRTLVNKYVSNELRQLALWSSLLLLYTQTWREVRQNWSLICEIFLNWGTNFVSLKSYEELCAKVAKIENDPEITHLMDLIYNSTNTINNTEQQDEEEDNNNNNDNDDEITEDVVDLSDFQNDHFYTKNVSLLIDHLKGYSYTKSIDPRKYFLLYFEIDGSSSLSDRHRLNCFLPINIGATRGGGGVKWAIVHCNFRYIYNETK